MSETDALVSFAGKTKYSDFAAEKLLGAPHLPGTRADSTGETPWSPSLLLGFFFIICQSPQYHTTSSFGSNWSRLDTKFWETVRIMTFNLFFLLIVVTIFIRIMVKVNVFLA